MNQSQTTVVNMDSVQKICLNPQTKKIWFFPINNTNGADLAEYDSVDKCKKAFELLLKSYRQGEKTFTFPETIVIGRYE